MISAKKRNKAYRIAQSKKHIQKKKNILLYVYKDIPEYCIDLKQPHRLDKAKVHCSCPLCAKKTSTNGWKHSDAIKVQK